MKITRWARIRFGWVALLAVIASTWVGGSGQIPGTLNDPPVITNRSGRRSVEDDMEAAQAKLPESYARLQSAERQRRLVNDTERLVTLTSQLKASIASSGAESLTPEMLRQMDEIEKLARSVKNKMRN